MVQTNTKKAEARDARLRKLPQSERLTKSALIKKQEGRVLNAAEKHAMKMKSEYGEMMRLWEVLRLSSDSSKDDDAKKSVNQQKLDRYEHKYPTVDQLLKIIEPKFDTYAKTPRASRVIQSMIKYSSLNQLERIVKLVSSSFTTHATDAYGHFVVAALIRHAPHTLLDKILSLIIPNVSSLISHRFGIEIIHTAYSNRLCTASNRNLLILSVFKENISLMKRWQGYPILEDILKQEETQQKRLLTKLFELCDKLVSQKGAVDYPFVQRLVAAYLVNGTKDEVSELCDTLRPYLAKICTTREGAPLASLAFSLIEPKKRKEVLRAFSENLGSLVIDKYSAPVIARLFDLMYDIQLLRKYIVNDLETHINTLINSPFGHQIILHLLTPHAERKAKFLLPNWFQHNLFSMENNSWNLHTWLTHEYKEETVEICSKSAINTHLSVLPSIIKKILEVFNDPNTLSKLNKHHTALIAREILIVQEAEMVYKKAFDLSEGDIELLKRLSPSSENKRPREEDSTSTVKTVPEKKTKIRRIDKSNALAEKKLGSAKKSKSDTTTTTSALKVKKVRESKKKTKSIK